MKSTTDGEPDPLRPRGDTARLARRRPPHRGFLFLTGLLAAISLIVSCTPPPPAMTPVPSPVDRASYRVMAGIEQIYVIGALQGDRIEVSSPGRPKLTGTADRLGSLAVRELDQGRTYTVTNTTSGVETDVRVLVADENPPQSFYDATKLHEGLNYIPMRDGITIAAVVRPPLGQSLSDGPFPTLIEYSGYQIAAPNEPVWSKLGTLIGLPEDPLAPAPSTDVGSLLMRLAGFAVVSVQLRGSGCSGGDATLFDLPDRYDGYDAVETVAAQNWVKGNRVGMVGVSFSGYSQIATASTHPPHLAAIAPMSFVGSLYDVAYPGGIFNSGFAEGWLAEREENARPAPDPKALPYANHLVRTDPQCRANQRLRLQTRPAVQLVKDDDLFGELYRRRDFREMMTRIDVPTFAFLQFNDEQTGAYAILSARELLGANDRVWLNLANGHHRDAISPDTITQLFEFLDIYVGRIPPQPKLLVNLLGGVIFGPGSATPPWPEITPPLDRLFDWPVSDAQRLFEAKPRVRVLLGRQSGMNVERSTGTQWSFGADDFPVPGSVDRTWYLGGGGRLLDRPGAGSTASYASDPAARPPSAGVPGATYADPPIEINWTQVPDGDGLGFVTEPLNDDAVALGPAAAEIRLSSNAADTDLGVTVSEVRPDGQEMLIAIGVQRASVRHTDPTRSTPVVPAYTLDRHEYLDGSTVTVPVQILPMGHVFRKGSRIRLGIHAAGGDAEVWSFDPVDPPGGTTRNTVHLGGAVPSTLTMTFAQRTGFGPTPLRCPAMGMPCRTYVKAANGG